MFWLGLGKKKKREDYLDDSLCMSDVIKGAVIKFASGANLHKFCEEVVKGGAPEIFEKLQCCKIDGASALVVSSELREIMMKSLCGGDGTLLYLVNILDIFYHGQYMDGVSIFKEQLVPVSRIAHDSNITLSTEVKQELVTILKQQWEDVMKVFKQTAGIEEESVRQSYLFMARGLGKLREIVENGEDISVVKAAALGWQSEFHSSACYKDSLNEGSCNDIVSKVNECTARCIEKLNEAQACLGVSAVTAAPAPAP